MNLGMIGPSLFITDNEPGYDRLVSVGSGGASSHHNQSDVDRVHLESTARSGGQSNHGFRVGQVYLPTLYVEGRYSYQFQNSAISSLLPTAYVVREEVIFSVCLSVHIWGGGYPVRLMGGGYPIPGPGGGGTPSQVQVGGYPIQLMVGRGGGYPIQLMVGGYPRAAPPARVPPHPGLGGGVPIPGRGDPTRGTPPSGLGGGPTWGTPHPGLGGGPTLGYPPHPGLGGGPTQGTPPSRSRWGAHPGYPPIQV